MNVGQIICVKKTSHFLESIEDRKENTERIVNFSDILVNSWNDYPVGDFGKLTFSPDIYDRRIIENCSSIK